MGYRPAVLMVLDGYGINKKTEGNAIAQGNTPVMDRLMKECPFQEGLASGLAVGLPDGQMGNSEVGHMNIGAGRVIYQDLTRISKAIEDKSFVTFSLNSFKILTVVCNASTVLFISACAVVAFLLASNA